MIICITGMPGAGKSEAGNFLVQKGFVEVEMSSTVKERMAELGIEVNNVNIREFSLNARKEHGNDVVAQWTMEKIRKMKGKHVLVVGLRSEDEAKYLKSAKEQVTIISIIAPKDIRFERMKERARSDDPKNYNDFEYREDKEKQFGIASAMEHADYVIRNTGTLEDLHKKLEEALAEIEDKEKKRTA